MKHAMRLGDYLDMDWFLEKDRRRGHDELLARDRQWGLEAGKRGLPGGQWPLFWLERRRADEEGRRLPSSLWTSFLTLAQWLAAACGFIGGVSLVRGLLQYFGGHPVNVSVFLLVAVFSQTALSVLALFFCLLRRPGHGLGAALIRTFFSFSVSKMNPKDSVAAGFTRTMLTRKCYARLLGWEIFGIMQLAGLCFALGALGGTLASVIVTDLAFGWQSTLQTGPEGMRAVVAVLSCPWRWLPDAWGLVPSLAQIEGSRIILKDGSTGLASADLTAWWPFLTACLAVYAVMPRAALLAMAHWRLRVLEAAFVHPDERRIADRMRTPHIRADKPEEERFVPLPAPSGSAVSPVIPPESTLTAVLVAGPEILDRVAAGELDALLRRTAGHAPGRIVAAELEAAQIRAILEQCSDVEWEGGHERFVVLVEAWQPPIQENLSALALLGHDQAMNRSLTLLLAGRPAKDNWLTAPSPTELRIWTEAVARLAPLRVDVIGVPE